MITMNTTDNYDFAICQMSQRAKRKVTLYLVSTIQDSYNFIAQSVLKQVTHFEQTFDLPKKIFISKFYQLFLLHRTINLLTENVL